MRPTNEEKIIMAIQMRDHKTIQEVDDEELLSFLMVNVGRAQAFKFNQDFNQVAFLVCVKRIKDSKLYNRLPHMNWEKFCTRILGVSRRKVDEDLQNIENYGAEHMQSLKHVGLNRNDLRAMRALPEGVMQFDENGSVEIDGEKFKLEPENSEAIKEAIDSIQERAREKVKEAENQAREVQEDIKAARHLIGEKDIKIRELTDRLENPKFAGPEEMFREIESIYATFLAGLTRLEAFPVSEATEHYKIMIRLRSLLEDAHLQLANYLYDFDHQYVGFRPDPDEVNAYREEVMRLAEEADELRAARKKDKK